MDELLGRADAGKRYLLLADTGMGKTSFLLHYFNRNQKRRGGKRLNLVMVSLARPDALNNLESVQSRNETVAFLDAFEEDIRALENRDRRMQEIMAVCGEFRCVVIACRTDFLPSDAAISRRHAFETIYLAPFSERQIRDYLRRCIPWHQWKRRREANSLAVSMADLATRPLLLALVPELAAAGRRISELFELYEFMVESWLQRERRWIAPDALRAASEKLAVAIYTRLSSGGIDRIDLDEAATILSVDASTMRGWQLTARSLLNRDAMGRFTFTDRSTLEYLFVSALLHGATQCLGVRWSDFTRRLFVSGANVVQERQGVPASRELLDHDFIATGLFPLSESHPAPRRLLAAESLNAAATPQPISLHAGPVWDPAMFVSEHHIADSLYLCDRSSDTIFFVPTDWRHVESGAVDPESARLFLFTRAEADSQIATLNANRSDDRSDWRPPTLEELDLIFLANRQLAFLPPELYVWAADLTTEGERLVVRMRHPKNDLDPRLNPIGMRTVLASNVVTTGYFVSSMPPLGIKDRRGRFDASSRALLIRVSHGGAEQFSIALNQRAVTPPTTSKTH